MNKKVLIFAATLVLGVAICIYCFVCPQSKFVNVVKASRGDITQDLVLTGEVGYEEIYSLSAMQEGVIKTVLCHSGDAVSNDEVVIELDTAAVDLQSEIIERESKEIFAADIKENSKLKELKKTAQSSCVDLSVFNNGVSTYSSESVISDIADESDRNDTDDDNDMLNVSSKTDGLLLEVFVSPGMAVSPGTVLATVGAADSKCVYTWVNESDRSDLYPGMECELTFSGSNACMKGRIKNIGIIVDNEISGMGKGSVIMIEADDTLPAAYGATAEIVITVDEAKNATTVPLEAVNEEDIVYVIKDRDTVEKRAVKVGLFDESNVQILEGVAKGEKVIVPLENQVLFEGETVKYDLAE